MWFLWHPVDREERFVIAYGNSMNGLHLCRVCRNPFELDALNWNGEARDGICDACAQQTLSLHPLFVRCYRCRQIFEPELTDEYLIHGIPICQTCSAPVATNA